MVSKGGKSQVRHTSHREGHRHCLTFHDVKTRELIADGAIDEGVLVDEFRDIEASLLVHLTNGAGHRRLVFVNLRRREEEEWMRQR